MSDYRVSLDVFEGPLDLLLHLVRQNEVDILDIPIAKITEQYLGYLGDLTSIDLERAGDFLVMAATLIEIKSRMMLPTVAPPAGVEEDPRSQLVEQLLEFRKYKDAAGLLEERARQWAMHYPRRDESTAKAAAEGIQTLREVELWDLVSAFDRLMRETLAGAETTFVSDETPLEAHMESIVARLAGRPQVTFRDLFAGAASRAYVVGVFLALLELVRLGRVRVEQSDDLGNIVLTAVDAPASETQNGSTA